MEQGEIQRDIGQSVEDNSGHNDTETRMVQCEVLTDSGQTVEGGSNYCGTEPTNGTV